MASYEIGSGEGFSFRVIKRMMLFFLIAQIIAQIFAWMMIFGKIHIKNIDINELKRRKEKCYTIDDKTDNANPHPENKKKNFNTLQASNAD